ncbi:MAG: RIO1 family regulatory kinase/ATPase [Nitrososphaerales archaeon]
MSTTHIAAQTLKSLSSEDWSVLSALERALEAYEVVPFEYISKTTNLHLDEVKFRLKRLDQLKLIHLTTNGATLVSAGLDALALRGFVKRNFISGIGPIIGVGKESDVYEAIDDAGRAYAVKFYRIGRISFRAIKIKRSYVEPTAHHHWLKVNISAAKKEFEAIKKLSQVGVSVPEVIARNRHALLMERIRGMLLVDCKELKEPKKVLKEILKNIRLAYTKAGIVNADLSEFNILCSDSKILLIDWPQAVSKEHPNATILLDRDVLNILKFFRRRFKIDCSMEDASFYVRGWRDSVELHS